MSVGGIGYVGIRYGGWNLMGKMAPGGVGCCSVV